MEITKKGLRKAYNSWMANEPASETEGREIIASFTGVLPLYAQEELPFLLKVCVPGETWYVDKDNVWVEEAPKAPSTRGLHILRML